MFRLSLLLCTLSLTLGLLGCNKDDDADEAAPERTLSAIEVESVAQFCEETASLPQRTPHAEGAPPTGSNEEYAAYHKALIDHVGSSSKATYLACQSGEVLFSGTLEWTKDGFQRARYDKVGSLYGAPLDAVFFAGLASDSEEYGPFVCSVDLGSYYESLFPSEDIPEALDDLEAACVAGTGDARDSVIWAFDIPDSTGVDFDAFMGVDLRTATDHIERSETTVAGRASTCFVLERRRDAVTEQCYSDDGTLTYARLDSRDGLATLRLIGDLAQPSDSDFTIPFELVNLEVND